LFCCQPMFSWKALPGNARTLMTNARDLKEANNTAE